MATRKRNLLAAAIAGTLLAGASSMALAQAGGYGGGAEQGGQPPQQEGAPPAGQQQPGAPQQPEQAEQPSFDEDTLKRFAGAYSEVQDIRDDYMARIQEADDAESAQELQQEAQSKMVDAVTDAGVEVTEYNEIAMRMGQDQEFAQRVMSLAEE